MTRLILNGVWSLFICIHNIDRETAKAGIWWKLKDKFLQLSIETYIEGILFPYLLNKYPHYMFLCRKKQKIVPKLSSIPTLSIVLHRTVNCSSFKVDVRLLKISSVCALTCFKVDEIISCLTPLGLVFFSTADLYGVRSLFICILDIELSMMPRLRSRSDWSLVSSASLPSLTSISQRAISCWIQVGTFTIRKLGKFFFIFLRFIEV